MKPHAVDEVMECSKGETEPILHVATYTCISYNSSDFVVYTLPVNVSSMIRARGWKVSNLLYRRKPDKSCQATTV